MMLAFDLETTGVDPDACRITCAGVFDPAAGIERCFVFATGDSPEEFMLLLDAADRLCGFNAVGFDIHFIERQFRPGQNRVRMWREKLVDVFEASRLALATTFSLDQLLEANGLPCKTGKGSDAIVMARQGRWDELSAYCLMDTRLTHAVSSLPVIILPKLRSICMLGCTRFGTIPCGE